MAQTYTYDAFGNMTNSTGSLTNFCRYTAREFDTETNLYYYRARYYDSSTGRFLSEDVARFRGGVDFYSYALNSPLDYIDPLGLQQTTSKWYEWKGWNWFPFVLPIKCSIWSHYCFKVAFEIKQEELAHPSSSYTNDELAHPQDEGIREIQMCTNGDQNCKNLTDQCGGPILGLIFKTGAFPNP